MNAKTLTELMGHRSITTIYDRYGHPLPGGENEARALMDAFLARADTAARVAMATAGS